MIVVTDTDTIELGTTEMAPTIEIVDFSRRVTDDYGVTTVVERGFARRMSVRLIVPFDEVDSLQRDLADLRATSAQWIADDRFEWLSVTGFYKTFELDLSLPPVSYCTLTVEGLAETETVEDPGGDPAPDGRPSTLLLLQPVVLTSAMLSSSSVPETDYAAWSAGTTYAFGARVIKASTHRIYESVAGGNLGNDPEGDSGLWTDIGTTNRWAMFDQALGTSTTATGSIVVVLDPGVVDSVALLDVIGSTVRVEATGYDVTLAAGPGTVLFRGLPDDGGEITVTLTGSGTVSIGTLLVGTIVSLGTTEANPSAGINDYSVKETDDFGDVTIVERAWAKRMAARSRIRTDAVDIVANRIASVRAVPSLWIGNEGTDSLTVYGFFRDFSIEVGLTVSTLSLSIEGLSKAPPPAAPLPGPNWTDIVDDDPTNHPKPADGATRNINRGEWVEGEHYLVGDIVQVDGSSYTCEVEHDSTLGTKPPHANWELFAAAGPEGPEGPTGPPGSSGSAGTPALAMSATPDGFHVTSGANGSVQSYSGLVSTVKVYAGTSDVTSSFNLSIQANPQGFTTTIDNGAKTLTVTGAGTSSGQFGHTGTDKGTITLRATGTGSYSGQTIDRVISYNKLKGGYEIVAALPATNLFEGRVVFLDTDGKLYRYHSGAWTKAVAGADIDDNTVTTDKVLASSGNHIANHDFATGDFTNWRQWTSPQYQSIQTSSSTEVEKYLAFTHPGSGTLSSSVFACSKAYSDVGADKDGFAVEPGKQYRVALHMAGSTFVGRIRVIAYFWKADGTYANSVVVSTRTEADITGSYVQYTDSFVAPAGALRCWMYIIVDNWTAGNLGVSNFVVNSMISTDLLVAKAVTSEIVDSQAIQTQHLFVTTPTDNLIVNGKGAEGAANGTTPGWVSPADYNVGTINTLTAQYGWEASGKSGFILSKSSVTNQASASSRKFRVQPGKTYSVKIKMGAASGGSAAGRYVRAMFAATEPASEQVVQGAAEGTDYITLATNAPWTGALTEYEYTFTAPAGRYWCSLSVINYVNGALTSYFSDVEVREQVDTVRIKNGSVTANEIAANAVTTNAMNAGAVTAAKIAVTLLSAISANLGTITAGLLQSVSGSTKLDLTNGRLIFDNGTTMFVLAGSGFGSSSQFFLWIGPTQANLNTCTEANAMAWVKTTGIGYWGGAVAGSDYVEKDGSATNITSSSFVAFGSAIKIVPMDTDVTLGYQPFGSNWGGTNFVYEVKWQYSSDGSSWSDVSGGTLGGGTVGATTFDLPGTAANATKTGLTAGLPAWFRIVGRKTSGPTTNGVSGRAIAQA